MSSMCNSKGLEVLADLPRQLALSMHALVLHTVR
jgi:hypothetical protein